MSLGKQHTRYMAGDPGEGDLEALNCPCQVCGHCSSQGRQVFQDYFVGAGGMLVSGHQPEVKELVPDFLVDANMIVGLII